MVAATIQPCDGQAFYDASDLLPAFDPDIALGARVVDVNADGRIDLYRRNRLYFRPENTGSNGHPRTQHRARTF